MEDEWHSWGWIIGSIQYLTHLQGSQTVNPFPGQSSWRITSQSRGLHIHFNPLNISTFISTRSTFSVIILHKSACEKVLRKRVFELCQWCIRNWPQQFTLWWCFKLYLIGNLRRLCTNICGSSRTSESGNPKRFFLVLIYIGTSNKNFFSCLKYLRA